MTDKHAYLIIAHSDFEQLKILLQMLDDERNDIYLHIDKKAKFRNRQELSAVVSKSKLYFVRPVSVTWGGSSQIKAELRLLKEADRAGYAYYHLISGVDLPIRSQNEIHTFFRENQGKNYVALERNHVHNLSKEFMYRVNYYYPFQNIAGRDKEKFLYRRQIGLLKFQQKHQICRTAKLDIEFVKGANWFTISHDAARYVMDHYPAYRRVFRWSLCADELFLQTILVNSPLADTIVDDNLRFVDWDRGNPYTFTSEDFDLLMGSGKLFARKFNLKVDRGIIDLLIERHQKIDAESAQSL